MVKLSRLSSTLALLSLSFSAWSAPPTTLSSNQGQRFRLMAVDRSDTDLPRRLPTPVTARKKSGKDFNTHNLTTKVSSSKTNDAVRVPLKAPSDIDLRGTVLESTAWTTPAYGVYNVPLTAGAQFSLVGASSLPITNGWDDGNGTYYSTYLTTDYSGYYVESCHLAAFNTSDWSLLYDEELPDFSMYSFGSAEDPTTGIVYGCCSNATYNGYDWVKIDYPSKSVTIVTEEIPIYFAAVGCDNAGQFYGVTEFGRFVKIDKATGEYTEYPSDPVLPAGTGKSAQHGGCVDDANGRFLLATYDPYGKTSALHSFDLISGQYTKLLDFPNGEQVLGLYIPAPPRAPLSPAAPGLSVTCENGEMEVKVKLTLPISLSDGSDATGQTFSYAISANGEPVKDGSGQAGKVIDLTIPMTISGLVNFTAVLSNEHGESPKTRAECYVGKGAPSTPANVTLSRDGSTATLSWEAVTTASDGGYLDPAAVTYTVRDAAGEIVKTGITATFATFEMEIPVSGVKSVRYSVAAVHDGKTSAFTPSNSLMLGSYSVPLEMGFDEETFSQHTVIDSNGDGVEWCLNFGKAMISYSFSLPMDDWLISPPVAMEANKTYPFKARVQATQSYYPERIEVRAGNSPTAEAMTISVVAPTVVDVESSEGLEISGNITTNEAGDYYVGFHGISDAGMYNLFVLSYQIGTCISGENPAAVADLKVTPDESGALTALITFTTPAVNIDGMPLEGDLDIIVTRDDQTEVYHRHHAPGSTVSFTDMVTEAGEYLYTVTAALGEDLSSPASATAYVGPKPAALVSKITAWQSAPDKVRLTWEPVTKDLYGNNVNPSDITYEVYSVHVNHMHQLELGDRITDTPISDTQYDAYTPPTNDQDYAYFAVKSLHRGVGDLNLTVGSTVFGNAYPLPHRISGKEEISKYFFEGWTSDSYAQINLGSSANGVPAQDGDDSYILVKTPYYDQSAYFATGRVSLAGATEPYLIFWIYGFENSSGDLNETLISVISEGHEQIEETVRHATLVTNRWNRIEVDLSSYIGKDIRVKITTLCNNTQYSLYDNIYIGENLRHDLSASLTIPENVKTGTPFTATVSVKNNGSEDAPQFDVRLLRDGEEVATRNITQPLASEEETLVTFDLSMGVHHPANCMFTAEVVYPADQYTVNNTSASILTSRIINQVPVVTSLSGEQTSEGNLLKWAPVLTGIPAPVTMAEGFENAESWAHHVDGWLFIDADQSPVGGLSGVTIPGITPYTSKASFFVWDYSMVGNDDTRKAPHSGDKYIASLFRADYGKSDDWAISPRLDSENQTVTFYAKSYSGGYPERLEVLYTSGEASDLDSYVKVENVGGTVPGDWTQYTFTLPAGTTHFAVRATSEDAYMLMLDDFTFKADNGFYGELLGYNVYCDRRLLNDTPVTEATFTHANPGERHTYHVTALYDSGESELSEPLEIVSSGIDLTTSEGLSIRVEGRTITVTGTDGSPVSLHGADGKTYHSGNGDCRLTVTPSTYLLSAGKTVRKLIIR